LLTASSSNQNSLSLPHDGVQVKILVSLPLSYPTSLPPQLQLLSRYIGAFSADSGLFGSILRTYISKDGVEWTPDVVCVFDGLQNVLERCTDWYSDHLRADSERREVTQENQDSEVSNPGSEAFVPETTSLVPEGITIVEAEAITDRKSVFVGRACRITDPSQVRCFYPVRFFLQNEIACRFH
jgi:hypothetical protein